jgi:hypothetical protein
MLLGQHFPRHVAGRLTVRVSPDFSSEEIRILRAKEFETSDFLQFRFRFVDLGFVLNLQSRTVASTDKLDGRRNKREG